MKRAILAFALLLSVTVFAKSNMEELIKFDKDSYSFGKVPQNRPVTYEFKFTNPASKPLIIESAVAECGCTTPIFPTKPIMKGKPGVIKVTYDAKNVGIFTKKVTVKLVNVPGEKVLTITGEVEAAK